MEHYDQILDKLEEFSDECECKTRRMENCLEVFGQRKAKMGSFHFYLVAPVLCPLWPIGHSADSNLQSVSK